MKLSNKEFKTMNELYIYKVISGKIGFRQDLNKNVNFKIAFAILNLFLPKFIHFIHLTIHIVLTKQIT